VAAIRLHSQKTAADSIAGRTHEEFDLPVDKPFATIWGASCRWIKRSLRLKRAFSNRSIRSRSHAPTFNVKPAMYAIENWPLLILPIRQEAVGTNVGTEGFGAPGVYRIAEITI